LEIAWEPARFCAAPSGKRRSPGKKAAFEGVALSRSARFRNQVWGPRRHRVRRHRALERRAGTGRQGVVPNAEEAKDLLDHAWVVNHRDEAHWVLTDRTAQRVHVPDPQNQVAPSPGGELERRRWGNARPVGGQLRRQPSVADAAHSVAVPTIVADLMGGVELVIP